MLPPRNALAFVLSKGHCLDRLQTLGAAILLSWNTEIVAGSYFGERLKNSPFERSFANFVALTFTTANLLFLAWANATQAKVGPLPRALTVARD